MYALRWEPKTNAECLFWLSKDHDLAFEARMALKARITVCSKISLPKLKFHTIWVHKSVFTDLQFSFGKKNSVNLVDTKCCVSAKRVNFGGLSGPAFSHHTVDGRNPPPVEGGSLSHYLSHYLQGFIHPRWLFGISSVNSSSPPKKIITNPSHNHSVPYHVLQQCSI